MNEFLIHSHGVKRKKRRNNARVGSGGRWRVGGTCVGVSIYESRIREKNKEGKQCQGEESGELGGF